MVNEEWQALMAQLPTMGDVWAVWIRHGLRNPGPSNDAWPVACALLRLEQEITRLQADIRDLARINDDYEAVCMQLMEQFGCESASALVGCIQERFAAQHVKYDALLTEHAWLVVQLNNARAELTSARPGRCVPERADDERMFTDDIAPPKDDRK